MGSSASGKRKNPAHDTTRTTELYSFQDFSTYAIAILEYVLYYVDGTYGLHLSQPSALVKIAVAVSAMRALLCTKRTRRCTSFLGSLLNQGYCERPRCTLAVCSAMHHLGRTATCGQSYTQAELGKQGSSQAQELRETQRTSSLTVGVSTVPPGSIATRKLLSFTGRNRYGCGYDTNQVVSHNTSRLRRAAGRVPSLNQCPDERFDYHVI